MMAHDSRLTPELRPLSSETLATLRAAVVRLWKDRDASEDELRDALAAVAAEAHARALRAEEVIVSFKALLADLPEIHTGARRMESTRFQEHLVTLCIKAYYK
jgi:hypothetical protein